jgi:hypothetical protein
MIGKDPKPVPEGYMNVELPPQQTGLREPRYVVMKKEVLERSIDPETGQDRAIPKVKGAPFDRKTFYPVFQPRTETEQNNIIKLINKERQKENKNPITPNQFNYITNQMVNALQAQEAVAEEMKRREDPYNYYVKKFKDEYDPKKHRQAIDNTASIFQIFRDPKKFAQHK